MAVLQCTRRQDGVQSLPGSQQVPSQPPRIGRLSPADRLALGQSRVSQNQGIDMIVYSNACSFGMPVGSPPLSYNSIIANHYGATLVSNHVPGSCNRRIVRSSLRDLIDLKQNNNDDILVLVGLSFIFRTELWQPDIPANKNDGHFHPIRTNSRIWKNKQDYYVGNIEKECEHADPNLVDWYKQYLLWQNKESLVTEQLADLIMFAAFCQQQNLKYLIWNNADLWPGPPAVDRYDIFIKNFVDHAMTNINLIDPWEFAFLPWALDQGLEVIDRHQYGDYGHPGPVAHERLANFLLHKIKEIK